MENPSLEARAPVAAGALHITAWLVIIAVTLAVVFPTLMMRGMFMDGVIYATVARNMAVGMGDLWHPAYTGPDSTLYETPPLGFLLESYFFRALGDQWWVERLFSLLTAVPTGILMVLIWRRLVSSKPGLFAFSWLPIALWVLIPNWSWTYRHNCLENTMGIFTALSVYGSLRALDGTRWWAAWTVVAALAVPAAVLCKGPVGMFPLIAPSLVWLTLRPQTFRRCVLIQALLLTFVAVAATALWQYPPAHDFLSAYFEQQVAKSLRGGREIVRSSLGQFHIVGALANDLLLPFILTAACVLWGPKRVSRAENDNLRGPLMFCLLTALSASLPIMVSPKQTAFYAAPSWPFYAMTLALWCAPVVVALAERIATRTAFRPTNLGVRIVAGGALAVSIALSPLWYGSICRDRSVILDVERIGRIVGPHRSLMMSTELRTAWGLHAYLYRWHYISLQEHAPKAYLLAASDAAGAAPPGWRLADTHLTTLRLFESADVAGVSDRGPNR